MKAAIPPSVSLTPPPKEGPPSPGSMYGHRSPKKTKEFREGVLRGGKRLGDKGGKEKQKEEEKGKIERIGEKHGGRGGVSGGAFGPPREGVRKEGSMYGHRSEKQIREFRESLMEDEGEIVEDLGRIRGRGIYFQRNVEVVRG